MLVLQYFQAIPQGQLPSPEGPLSSSVHPAAVCAAMSVFRLHNLLAIKIKPAKNFSVMPLIVIPENLSHKKNPAMYGMQCVQMYKIKKQI